MKILIVFLSLIFSSIALSEESNTCVTHAQCQNIVDESTGCFLVKNSEDQKSCSVKCFRVFIGSFCSFEEGKSYGVCKTENYKTPKVDTKKPDCSKAIPNSVVENLFEI